MADINLKTTGPSKPLEPAAPRSGEPIWDIIELLFYAYRDFVGDADEVLKEFGFGRAHHRVIHFVHRYPGLKVADLLDVLRITKQSLGRVLKQLIEEDYIVQRAGESDKRQRLLFATAKGEALVAKPDLASLAAQLPSRRRGCRRWRSSRCRCDSCTASASPTATSSSAGRRGAATAATAVNGN